MTRQDVDHAMEVLLRGTAEVIDEADLRRKLEKSLATGRPLTVKLGADPSAPDLHLGHGVVLKKLRQFQDLGHQVVFLIGDFTGRIGDPTDRSDTRRPLTEDEVRRNAATYESQVYRILDPKKTQIAFNSTWLAPLTFEDVIRLAATQTVARMLEREDFKLRFKSERPIHLHEFFYPLMQGQDSVAMKADVELGGTDQKFNLLMARHLMRESGQEPEVAMLMPLLVGTDGVQKMSKSLGNQIGLDDSAGEMFGKIMSIPDAVIADYMRIATTIPLEQVARWERQMEDRSVNPRDAKEALGMAVVSEFWGEEAAGTAAEEFKKVFAEGVLPKDMPEVILDEERRLVDVMRDAGLVESLGEARRLIDQGAVSLEGRPLKDAATVLAKGTVGVLKVGKRRYLRIRA